MHFFVACLVSRDHTAPPVEHWMVVGSRVSHEDQRGLSFQSNQFESCHRFHQRLACTIPIPTTGLSDKNNVYICSPVGTLSRVPLVIASALLAHEVFFDPSFPTYAFAQIPSEVANCAILQC